MELHHIVEQSQAKPERSDFSVERINSTDNLTRIPSEVHRDISADYSRKVFGLDITLRDSLNGTSWEHQYEVGSKALDQFRRGPDDER